MAPGQLFVGTSGWHYPHWRRAFYPASLAPSQWLRCYADHFPAVEVNASFYRLPEEETIRAWCAQTPQSFRFAVKAPRAITHFKKLKHCEQALTELDKRLEAFGERLGPVLFQLPPRWRCNPRRLADFLQALPAQGPRYAFEFRDPSWHEEEVYELLRAHDAAFCVFDLAGHTSAVVETASLAYLRLHGPRAAYTGSYGARTLRRWLSHANDWLRTGRDVYVFFDNDQSAFAVRNARRALELTRAGLA